MGFKWDISADLFYIYFLFSSVYIIYLYNFRQDEDDLGDDLFQFEDNKKNKLRPSRSRSVKVPPKVPTKAPTKPTPSIISSNSKIHLSSSGAESEDDEDKPLRYGF